MRLAPALLAAMALTAFACGRGEEAPPPGTQAEAPVVSAPLDYLVEVGDSRLSESAFAASIPAEFRGLLTIAEKRGYVDRWVDTELLYRAAEDRGLLEDPELVRRLEQQRREFIANHLLQKMLEERVLVTDGEIADYYSEHLEEYSSEYRYREIVVRTQQDAQDLHDKLKAKRISFTRAAERNSLSASSRTGGDMGWLAKGAMPPEVEERIVKMKPQEISQPFETAWGWTLIQFRDRRQAENALDLQEVKDEILRFLTMERRRRVYAEFLEEVQESYPVRYHPSLEQRLRSDEFVSDPGPGGR